jgi:hypothetical protein
MKRLLLVASIASVLFSSNFGHAYAAGLYDGEWNGSARVVKNGRCRPANVTLTVLDNQAVGQAKFDLAVQNIAGTVRPDGLWRHNRIPAPHGEIHRGQVRRELSGR